MLCRRRFQLFFALAGALLVGCRHTVVAPTAPDEGTSSYKFIDPAPPPSKKTEIAINAPRPTTQSINAQPILPLATPMYPAAALAARAGMATVGVRIVVDAAGRVAEVHPSLAILSMPSPFAAEFQAAVEAAVRQWRFHPAELRQLELVRDPGGDFMRVASREKIEWAFDVEFTFSATGDVLTRLPATK
jgi:TonB family protein